MFTQKQIAVQAAIGIAECIDAHRLNNTSFCLYIKVTLSHDHDVQSAYYYYCYYYRQVTAWYKINNYFKCAELNQY